MKRIGLGVLICTATPLAAQGVEWQHPCPAAVDTSSAALATVAEPRFDSADPARPSYFRRFLQMELHDTIGPEGLCRILEAAGARALMAWQPQRAVHVLIRLEETPGSIDELDEVRASIEEIAGVGQASRMMVPRAIWR